MNANVARALCTSALLFTQCSPEDRSLTRYAPPAENAVPTPTPQNIMSKRVSVRILPLQSAPISGIRLEWENSDLSRGSATDVKGDEWLVPATAKKLWISGPPTVVVAGWESEGCAIDSNDPSVCTIRNASILEKYVARLIKKNVDGFSLQTIEVEPNLYFNTVATTRAISIDNEGVVFVGGGYGGTGLFAPYVRKALPGRNGYSWSTLFLSSERASVLPILSVQALGTETVESVKDCRVLVVSQHDVSGVRQAQCLSANGAHRRVGPPAVEPDSVAVTGLATQPALWFSQNTVLYANTSLDFSDTSWNETRLAGLLVGLPPTLEMIFGSGVHSLRPVFVGMLNSFFAVDEKNNWSIQYFENLLPEESLSRVQTTLTGETWLQGSKGSLIKVAKTGSVPDQGAAELCGRPLSFAAHGDKVWYVGIFGVCTYDKPTGTWLKYLSGFEDETLTMISISPNGACVALASDRALIATRCE